MRLFPLVDLNIAKFSLLNSTFLFFLFSFFLFIHPIFLLYFQCADEYTRDGISRRRFFERFAKKKGFNPKKAENWYPFQRGDFMKEKVTITFI